MSYYRQIHDNKNNNYFNKYKAPYVSVLISLNGIKMRIF